MTTMLTINGIRYRQEDAEEQGLMPVYRAQEAAAAEARALEAAQAELQRLQSVDEGQQSPGGAQEGEGAGDGSQTGQETPEAGTEAVSSETAEGKSRAATTRNKARGAAADKAAGQ